MDVVQRKGSKHRILSQRQIEQVHDQVMRLLEDGGSRVLCPEALEILATAGCDVSDSERVRIPARLVDDALQKAPQAITVYDRNGAIALRLEQDACYYGNGSDCVHTIDLDTGERRLCMKQDVADLARFCDALPNMDFVMSFGIANDAPCGKSFVHQYETMLLNTTKPVVVTGHGRNDMIAMAQMAACTLGSAAEVHDKPSLILYSEPLSPLVHTDMGLSKVLVCCEWDIPFIYIGSPMLGASGPVTLEGTLVQAVAESLAGLVIAQNKKPGAKFIFGGDASAMDMRHSVYSYGAPELNLLNAALADMAHHYRLPFFCIAGATDAKSLDAQAGSEYALSIFNATLNGCNLIHDCGYLESGLTSSFESLLFADEIVAMTKFMLKPLDFANNVPLETMIRVGPAGTFLTEEHTTRFFRDTLWFPRFMNRENYDAWKAHAHADIRGSLNQQAHEIFEAHQPERLPDSVVSAIRDLVDTCRPDI